MEHLQRCLIRMEHCSAKQLFMQLLIHWGQIILRCPQDPVGHGLPAQRDTLATQLLLLSV